MQTRRMDMRLLDSTSIRRQMRRSPLAVVPASPVLCGKSL
jgi:hypothetical protein